MSLRHWRSVPLILVDDLRRPELRPDDLHHFSRVRRLHDATPITISDGRGRWRPALFGATPEPTGDIVEEPPPVSPSAVGFTPVKGERPEWVVQKLTELGIDVIIPLRTDRSVVRWDDARAEKHVTKWRAVAREASMQSRRVRLPDIRPLTTLDSLEPVGSAGSRPVLAEPGGPPLDGALDRAVLVGPEGGWSAEELEGRPIRSLPGGILRAETAAVAAAVILAAAGSRSVDGAS